MKLPIDQFLRVSVIILNWNGGEYLRKCLDSVLKTDYSSFEVIVVDNASTDGSRDMVKKEYPQVKLIENKENLGFCVGNNIGIERASGDIIILLNNDTIVDENWLEEVVKKTGEPRVGIIGCRLYYPGSKIIQSLGYREVSLGMWEELIGSGQVDGGQFDVIEDVDYVSGAAMAIRREVIEKIGLLDPFCYAFSEDKDISYRCRKAGYRVVTSNAIVYHYGSVSWDQFPLRKVYSTRRSQLYFIMKHYPPRALLGYVFAYPIKSFKADLCKFIRGETVLQKLTTSSRRKRQGKTLKRALSIMLSKNIMLLIALLFTIIRGRKPVYTAQWC